MVDQAASSFTNFLLVACVARVSGLETFGAFSVAFVVYLLALAVFRALVTEPFAVRYSAEGGTGGEVVREVAGTALGLGLVLGALVATVATLAGGRSAAMSIVVAGMLPALLLQDSLRVVLLAQGRPVGAAALDALWLAAQVLATAALTVTGHSSALSLLFAFGGGAGLSAVVGATVLRVRPAVGRARSWLRTHADLGRPLVVELLVVNGAPQVALLVLATTGQPGVVGRMRAALLLFGPLSMLFTGLVLAALPEAVRLQGSPPALRGFLMRLALAMPCLGAAWTLALVLVPSRLGEALLGSNWAGARALVPAVGIFVISSGCTFAGLVGLKAAGAVSQSLRARAWSVPVTWAGALAGVAWAGAPGAAGGIALGSCLDTLLTWAALGRVRRAVEPGADGPWPVVFK